MTILERFMPHGMCYAWRPDVLWLHVLSDATIAIAYFSIPFALYHFLRRRPDVPFRGVLWMFSIFILACGVTHVMSIVVVWNGYYLMQGALKALTSLASLVTACMLYPILPKLLALRSPLELEVTNNALQLEMEERKKSETQSIELQNELAHMGRVTNMGQMATGLAHELNQPLVAISQYADAAKSCILEDNNKDPELAECLSGIQAQTQRAGEIIHALRNFISKDTEGYVDIDLNALIRQTVRLISSEARKKEININYELGSLPPIRANRVQIAQVIMNLVRNSMEAISNANTSARDVIISTSSDANTVSLRVKDTGPGIDESINPFYSFQSNKPGGMGVGLSICQTIVEAHSGKIELDNHSKTGAEFLITLPL